MHTRINLSARKITTVLAIILVVLVVIALTIQVLQGFFGIQHPSTIFLLFNFDEKTNFPTAFKLFGLSFSALLIYLVARAKKSVGDKYALHWKILSLVFVYLTLDEEAKIHQTISHLLSRVMNTSGIFTFPWVIIYLPLVVIFGLAYLKFFFHLPLRTRWLFLAAAIGYAGGSGGVELIKAQLASRIAMESVSYQLVALVSDTMECVGLIIFINALLHYLARYVNYIELDFLSGERKVATGLDNAFDYQKAPEGAVSEKPH